MSVETTDDPRDVLSPRAARRQFLDAKRGTVKDSTVRAYKFPTKHFVQYCENEGVDVMADVDNYVIEQWIQAREAEDVKPITVNKNVRLVRVFIKWCENSGLLDHGTYDRVRVPDVPEEEESSDKVLEAHPASQIKQHLSTYKYASRHHVMFRLMWETACRASGAVALDVDDIGVDREGDPTLEFKNRKAQGTALKNGNKSERIIFISEGLNDLLHDYIQTHRHDVTDEYGREPLLTTPTQRLTRERAYKDTVAITRPCVYSGECPVDRDIDHCEAAQYKKKATGCPVRVNPHPIRRGSITDHLDRGWEKEKLSERVDVSVDVLEKHYDARTKKQELQGRKKFKDL